MTFILAKRRCPALLYIGRNNLKLMMPLYWQLVYSKQKWPSWRNIPLSLLKFPTLIIYFNYWFFVCSMTQFQLRKSIMSEIMTGPSIRGISGIATGYEWPVFDSWRGQDILLDTVQKGSRDRQAYPLSAAGSFPGIKRPGRETGHPPSSCVKVKKYGATSALPRMSSWHGI
jgi:hypothetical protein